MADTLEIRAIEAMKDRIHVVCSDGVGIELLHEEIPEFIRQNVRRSRESLIAEALQRYVAATADAKCADTTALKTALVDKRLSWADPTTADAVRAG
jgi:hypothetical protein